MCFSASKRLDFNHVAYIWWIRLLLLCLVYWFIGLVHLHWGALPPSTVLLQRNFTLKLFSFSNRQSKHNNLYILSLFTENRKISRHWGEQPARFYWQWSDWLLWLDDMSLATSILLHTKHSFSPFALTTWKKYLCCLISIFRMPLKICPVIPSNASA